MKKKRATQPAFFNPCILVGLFVFFTGILLALAQRTADKRNTSANTSQLATLSSDRDVGAVPNPKIPTGGVLWDQYNNPATESPINISSQDFDPAFAALTDQAADDFIITAPPPPMFLYIDGVHVMGEYSEGGGPASSFNVYFYTNGVGNLPGTQIVAFLNQPYTGTPPDFVIHWNPFSLPSGTYWVSVQARQDFNPNGQWFWHNRTVQSGNAGAAWQNPGNGYDTGCISWNRKNACLSDQVWPDQVFQILGFPEGPTPTATATAPHTPTPTATFTPTSTLTATASPTQTPTAPSMTPCDTGWHTGPDMPSTGVRMVGVYFPVNGKFYAVGGRSMDGVGNDFVHPFEYNPGFNIWNIKSATFLDNQVSNMACGVLYDSSTPYIYCVGGSAGGQTTATSRVFRYDPLTDIIENIASPWPGDADGITLPGGFSVFNNKLYILGGFKINTAMTNQIWEFTPTTNVWVLKNAVLPVARGYIPTATYFNYIYTAGGSDWDGTTLVDTNDSFKYDPVADSITTVTSIPRATGETGALKFAGPIAPCSPAIRVMGGGRTPPNPSNEVDIFCPDTIWNTGSPFVIPRRNFPTDTDVGNPSFGSAHIWLAGGYGGDGTPLSSMEIYCYTVPTPSEPPFTPSATATFTATPTATHTPTPTATFTPPATATATFTASVTPTPSEYPHPTPRPYPTPRARPTPPPRP